MIPIIITIIHLIIGCIGYILLRKSVIKDKYRWTVLIRNIIIIIALIPIINLLLLIISAIFYMESYEIGTKQSKW